MDKSNTKMFVEIDANSVSVKQLLKKDFLELQMRAISSANPNRNNSWFTKESMERSLDSFVNKPILGYFENGDFVSHNGDWKTDPETNMDYWDTLGQKGERVLGIIRESDDKIIETDKNGLSWIKITCALWVQYSFKQVKRLIKDAKRAQQTGESTKNISVEVDITDYEMLDNGVMKINAFNLVGITILGSRNGVKVEPGIEDAELSVVDVMGREVYSQQEKSLRLAYEKLNDSVTNKEENQVENEEIKQSETAVETFEAGCEESKQNESIPQDEGCQHCEECPEEKTDNGCGEEPHENECGAKCEEDPECKEEEACGESQQECGAKCEELSSDTDGDHKEDDDDGDDDCDCGKCGEQCACESEENVAIESLKAEYESLKSDFENLKSEYEAAKVKIEKFEHDEFMRNAKQLISSSNLDSESASKFEKACFDKEIKTIDDLKVKVAVCLFDSNMASRGASGFSAPVSEPNTKAAFESVKPSKKAAYDPWAKLHDYTNQ